MDKRHPFIGSTACILCGQGVNADIHTPPFDDYVPGDFNPQPSAVDALLTQFPSILISIMEYKRLETVRGDIARLAAALIISGKEHQTTAVDTACYLYERIEAATSDWGKK